MLWVVNLSPFHCQSACRMQGCVRHAIQDEYAATRNIPYVKLQVFAGNTHARVVYQALGYQDVAVTMVKQITNKQLIGWNCSGLVV
jgi:hypothetical protein